LLGANPHLSPPADHGGAVPTMALGFQSAALDLEYSAAAPGTCPLPDGTSLGTDARGVARPVDQSDWIAPRIAKCDAGAFEQNERIFNDGFGP
ncbi:MAG TPA: choice-of-anchor Q domain-containing protein, partial [Rudaea sp.]|nr:choice-of-anchor Q domain-containing protein [Rudaea sp.]